MLPYSIEEITRRVSPVAKKYGLPAVFLFGSYARGEATAESDIDLLVDLSGTGTLDSMEEPTERPSQLQFREAVKQERKMIYAAA